VCSSDLKLAESDIGILSGDMKLIWLFAEKLKNNI
jgi:hypothetical protein